MEYSYQEMDQTVATMLADFRDHAARDGKVYLANIDATDESHLGVVHIASIASLLYGIPFVVDMPLFQYWKLRRVTKYIKMKFTRGHAPESTYSVRDYQLRAYADTDPGIFASIYNEYYSPQAMERIENNED